MNMRAFLQNKLWRQKAIDMCVQNGSIIHTRQLSAREFEIELKKKLVEEAYEVLNSQSRDALVEELADLFEVIDVLCVTHAISRQEIVAMQQEKRTERGNFSPKTFVETTEHPIGSAMERYCQNQPDKYPEVK